MPVRIRTPIYSRAAVTAIAKRTARLGRFQGQPAKVGSTAFGSRQPAVAANARVNVAARIEVRTGFSLKTRS
jgi:hypothetical protein